MANAQVLQNAANRFASVAGFAPLAVDGEVGSRTLAATQKALSFISIETDGSPIPITVSEQAAAFAAHAATSASVLSANSMQVGAFLNYVADMVHLPAIYGPQVVPQTNGNVAASAGLAPLAPMGRSNWMASISDAFKRMATWQKVALGFVGVVGVFAIAGKVKDRKQLEGYRY